MAPPPPTNGATTSVQVGEYTLLMSYQHGALKTFNSQLFVFVPLPTRTRPPSPLAFKEQSLMQSPQQVWQLMLPHPLLPLLVPAPPPPRLHHLHLPARSRYSPSIKFMDLPPHSMRSIPPPLSLFSRVSSKGSTALSSPTARPAAAKHSP